MRTVLPVSDTARHCKVKTIVYWLKKLGVISFISVGTIHRLPMNVIEFKVYMVAG